MQILIVEDDTMLLDNLRLLLSGEAGISVMGAFNNAEDALMALQASCPDILLTDLGLPGMSGVELIRSAKTLLPRLDILAYTIFEDPPTIFAALKSGATGYILKGCTPRELVEALFNLHKGGAPMSPRIARLVIQELQNEVSISENLLTRREKEVLIHLSKGSSYKEIASSFNISPHTVHSHIKKIYEKLQAKDRRDAVTKFNKMGIYTL